MRLSVALALVTVLMTRTALADEGEKKEHDYLVDGLVVAAAGFGWAALYSNERTLARASCPCERGDVPGIDKGALDNRWSGASHLSWGVASIALLLPIPLLMMDSDDLAWELMLVAESVLLTGFFTESVKLAVSRPYPYMYRERDPARLNDPINYTSFWSGHTAVPMASLSALAALYAERHPDSTLKYVLWALAPAMALTAGFLQFAAGNHFPTDIGAGLTAGFGVGAGNVWLR